MMTDNLTKRFENSNLILEELISAYNFADLICTAGRSPVFVDIWKVGPNGYSTLGISDWAGFKPNKPSRAPYIAGCKASELVWAGKSSEILITPVPNLKESFGWKGGIRFKDYIAAISHLSEEHDLLYASLVIFNLAIAGNGTEKIYLHHVGFNCTQEEFEAAKFIENNIQVDDHRLFVPSGNYCTEYFYDPEERAKMHFDFVCSNPYSLLNFLAFVHKVKFENWPEASKNEPCGRLYIEDKNGVSLAILVHKKFYKI